jgi:hypothetical protein
MMRALRSPWRPAWATPRSRPHTSTWPAALMRAPGFPGGSSDPPEGQGRRWRLWPLRRVPAPRLRCPGRGPRRPPGSPVGARSPSAVAAAVVPAAPAGPAVRARAATSRLPPAARDPAGRRTRSRSAPPRSGRRRRAGPAGAAGGADATSGLASGRRPSLGREGASGYGPLARWQRRRGSCPWDHKGH